MFSFLPKILDATIKTVNKSKLVVWFFFSVNFLKIISGIRVKSSKPKNLCKKSVNDGKNKYPEVGKCLWKVAIMYIRALYWRVTACSPLASDNMWNKWGEKWQKKGSVWNAGLRLKVLLCHSAFGLCWATF